MIAFFAVLSAAFVIWRAVLTIPRRRVALKIILSVVVLLAAFKFQIFHLFGGPVYFAPELPRWLLLIGALVYAVHFIFFVLLLASELCRLLARSVAGIFKLRTSEKIKKNLRYLNLALFAVALIVAGVGIFEGIRFPAVRKVEMEIAALPRKADNLKIVFLTDLHINRMSDPEWLPLIVAKVNSLDADLILLGGDLVDGNVDRMGKLMLPLRDLRARYGVYGVPGNHEYYSGFVPWINFLENECNVHMLINTSVKLPCGLTLVGVGDYAGKRFGLPVVNFRQALREVAHDEPVILLAHRPDLAREAGKLDVMLQLSGHTHGGMFPGLNWMVKRLNGGFVSGEYRSGVTRLYVSNGTGIWSGFPVRFGVPSEITLIKLERDE